MLPRRLVRLLYVGSRLIVRTEELDIGVRILVADRLVREEPQRLMISNGPTDLLRNIGFDELSAPIAVVDANQRTVRNVVQQTRQHDLLLHAALERHHRALQQMSARKGRKPPAKEIQKLRLLRHGRESR